MDNLPTPSPEPVEESKDGGISWTLASNGVEVPWAQSMVERFVQVGDQLLAVLSNGQLLVAALATLTWQRILREIVNVNAATVMAS